MSVKAEEQLQLPEPTISPTSEIVLAKETKPSISPKLSFELESPIVEFAESTAPDRF